MRQAKLLVIRLELQEVEQIAEVFTVVRLRGGAVVIAIFFVMFDHRLHDEFQVGHGFAPRVGVGFQVIEQLRPVGVVFERFEPAGDAAVQDAAQVGQGQELGREQVAAEVLDEIAQGVPFRPGIECFQHR